MRKLKIRGDGPSITAGRSNAVGAFALFFESTRKEAGAILSFLAEATGGCSAARLTDLLVLGCQRAAQRGECLLAVRFHLWAVGIVQPDLFVDMALPQPVLMAGYLMKDPATGLLHAAGGGAAALPEAHLALLRGIVEETAAMSDGYLHAMLTGEASLWRSETLRQRCAQAFARRIAMTSGKEADFGMAVGDPALREAYYRSYGEKEEAGMYYEGDE